MGRKKHSTTPGMWLDELPEEVCVRIAAFVTRGAQNKDGLALAQASPKQGNAVVSTLSHKLVFDYTHKRQVAQWLELLSDNVREINVLDWDLVLSSSFRFGYKKHLLKMLNASTLQTAEISADKPTLRAIKRAPSLRKLHVHLYTDCPTALLLETLSCLRLEDLTLDCNGYSEECPIENFARFTENGRTLGQCLPHLKALEVRCFCNGHNDTVWRFLPTTPSVREVRLNSEPPEAALPTLKALDAVEITNVPHGKFLARRLGSSVTKLFVQDEALDAEDIASLRNCPNLRDLSIVVADGAEVVLLDIIGSIRGLRTLYLVSRRACSVAALVTTSQFPVSWQAS